MEGRKMAARMEEKMSFKLQVVKDDTLIYERDCDIADATSFGHAFADLWGQLKQKQFDRESSIGALMEHLDDQVIDQLDGAQIRLRKC
jgi:hypothetical protein